MYSNEILKRGLEYLGIDSPTDVAEIVASNITNTLYIKECEERELKIQMYRDRFKIPLGATKTAIRALIKQTNQKIYALQDSNYEKPSVFKEIDIEDYVAFNSKLKATLIFTGNNKDRITQAKSVPITNYIEFSHIGFAKCLWHDEKSGSMKYYPKRNKVHCFGCGQDADTIDVVQQLMGMDLPGALKIILE